MGFGHNVDRTNNRIHMYKIDKSYEDNLYVKKRKCRLRKNEKSIPPARWISEEHLGHFRAFHCSSFFWLIHFNTSLSPLMNCLHVIFSCQGAEQRKHQTNEHSEHWTCLGIFLLWLCVLNFFSFTIGTNFVASSE